MLFRAKSAIFYPDLQKTEIATMSPAVVVEKEPVPAAEKAAPKTAVAAASKAEKRKVPPTEAAPSVAAKKAAPPTVTLPAATEPAKQVGTFFELFCYVCIQVFCSCLGFPSCT
jgi:hypothetical protein